MEPPIQTTTNADEPGRFRTHVSWIQCLGTAKTWFEFEFKDMCCHALFSQRLTQTSISHNLRTQTHALLQHTN